MELFNKIIQKSAALAKKRSICALFDTPTNRADDFSVSAADLYLDYAKQNITQAELEQLITWANDHHLSKQISGMFLGKKLIILSIELYYIRF
ncbi:hypothetical protein L3081_18825 [Colwellia sp. MSW7]|uniref:Uncharacterized protein n=1 Tax=Colwellia maritima TaxID=2912588 RepID=A0ABS9X497_9GAMM|nr:hypothetical protein [Colwellia maritima]MCI2285073.1 hypothetical protein [Colwellia maritima]